MSISDKSKETINNILTIQDENKMLREEVETLKEKLYEKENEYFWGLSAEDLVMALVNEEQEIKEEEVYSKQEYSNKELIKKINNNMKESGFYVYEWYEDVQQTKISEETLKLIKTYAKRFNSVGVS